MKISIITACYNSENTIEDSIKSVISQDYQNFEYLIIDGKSTDNTLSIVNKYQSDPRIKIISEKDKGLYDALNKGITLSTGDVVAILNSDDVLYDKYIFSSVISSFDDNSQIVYANVQYYNNDFTKVIRDYISGKNSNDYWCPAHPSMYVKKEVFGKIGLYNIDYKICSDYDFMIRCNRNNISFKYVDKYFVKMRYGGASNGFSGYIKNYIECYKVLKNNGIKFPLIKTTIRAFITIGQLVKNNIS